jgi:hypothetical protein
MDINALFEKDGMRDFTAEQRDTFMNDGQQIRQMQRIVQARLAQITLEGDRPGAAGRRARKMAKRFGKLAGLLEKAAAQCEGINTAYVHDVLELPDRRMKALEAKENRRQRLGIAASGTQDAIAQSLTKSAHAFNGAQQAGNPQVTPVQQAPQYNAPYPHQFAQAGGQQQPVGDIASFFPEAL